MAERRKIGDNTRLNRKAAMNPRKRFDSHVHSRHSPDGADDLAAFAARVDAGVADGIGFAEHYDFLPVCGAWQPVGLKARSLR